MAHTVRIVSLVLVATTVASMFSFLAATRVGPGVYIGLPRALGIPIGFALVFLISWLALTRGGLERGMALGTLAVPLVGMVVAHLLFASPGLNLKALPVYTAWGLGLGAAWLLVTRSTPIWPLVLAMFPAAMVPGPYDTWAHRIDFGAWTSRVAPTPIGDFAFLAADGTRVTRDSLQGKVVLLDFWFSTCPACWKKFPELQRVHAAYRAHPDFRLYAVNRGDNPEEDPHALVGERGHDFPVLVGSPEAMDALGVTSYPTVILLDRAGNVVFKGDVDAVEGVLEGLLAAP